MAKLYFRYGAMGCGKTAQLLQVAFNYKEKGMNVCVMKPKIDTKAGDKLQTRIGIEREIDYLIDKDDDVYEIVKNKFNKSNCVLIDEAQFLSKSQVDNLMEIVVKLNIPVMCYGLRTDFLTNGFSGSIRLLEIAHSIEELKTICKCGRKATFNARYVDGNLVTSGETVVIDNDPSIEYISLCPHCYYEKIDKK